MKIWPLLLLLGGCASTPIEEMYVELAVCANAKLDCTEMQEAITNRELRISQRQYDRSIRCPEKTFEYCRRPQDKGCGRAHKRPDDQFSCVFPGQLGIFF